MINRGGVKVSATKIEEILEALPEIKEAAACGVEGASGLEEIWIADRTRSRLIDSPPRSSAISKNTVTSRIRCR